MCRKIGKSSREKHVSELFKLKSLDIFSIFCDILKSSFFLDFTKLCRNQLQKFTVD